MTLLEYLVGINQVEIVKFMIAYGATLTQLFTAADRSARAICSNRCETDTSHGAIRADVNAVAFNA